MKNVILALLLCLNSYSYSQDINSLKEIAKRCDPLKPSSPLYANEFKWGYGLQELISKFFDVYHSKKRLPLKAYWDKSENQLLLPIREAWGAPVPISEVFVKSVSRHIEKAFDLHVIDGVFFPDMGHSHLLIPEQHFEKNYSHFAIQEFSKMYEKFFKDPQVEILYHTAEQLRMLNDEGQLLTDPRVQFRHRTRNPVGAIRPDSELKFLENKESPANTAGAPSGYVWWGSGFNLSANQEGCFAYTRNGQVQYYDISLFDLNYDPDQAEVFNNF